MRHLRKTHLILSTTTTKIPWRVYLFDKWGNWGWDRGSSCCPVAFHSRSLCPKAQAWPCTTCSPSGASTRTLTETSPWPSVGYLRPILTFRQRPSSSVSPSLCGLLPVLLGMDGLSRTTSGKSHGSGLWQPPLGDSLCKNLCGVLLTKGLCPPPQTRPGPGLPCGALQQSCQRLGSSWGSGTPHSSPYLLCEVGQVTGVLSAPNSSPIRGANAVSLGFVIQRKHTDGVNTVYAFRGWCA